MPQAAFAAIAAALVAAAAAPAAAQRPARRDQDQAFAAVQAGQVLPLHQIEARVVPRMAGYDYLGPEFDPATAVYRLKFMRGGSVVWIDVDGRSGQVVGRSGD